MSNSSGGGIGGLAGSLLVDLWDDTEVELYSDGESWIAGMVVVSFD